MRKLVLGLAGAAALALSTSANADVVNVNGIDSGLLNADLTESFAATIVNQAQGSMFSVTFPVHLDFQYNANGQVSSILLDGNDLDFTSVSLGGYPFSLFLSDVTGDGLEIWRLNPAVQIGPGDFNLIVEGVVAGTAGGGSFGGNINLAAVPEPGTWAMMLLGFGAVGFAMRRRRTPALAQVA